jgi:hypothetical protein
MGISLGIEQTTAFVRKLKGAEERYSFTYRTPTTKERNEYLAKVTRYSRLAQSSDDEKAEKAITGLMQLRVDYGLKIVLAADGFDLPEDADLKPTLSEFGSVYVAGLSKFVFEGQLLDEDIEVDLGKSEGQPEPSTEEASA